MTVLTPFEPPKAEYGRLIVNGRTATRRGATSDPSTVTSLRQRNRSLLLKRIITEQETTRAELAQATGLSSASVGNIIVGLIDEGLVEERGSRSSQGGRPIAVIAPRADRAITIGIDVGERGIAAEVFDLSMNRVDREFRGGQAEESPESIAGDIRAALHTLNERNASRWKSLIGVGLGLPGIVEDNPDGTQTLYAQSLRWNPVGVADLCSLAGTPVYAENGSRLQARAELWFGNAKNADDAVIAMLGRGVGLGIVTAGELMSGSRSAAGEWGHTTLQLNGEICRCGNRGCVEAYIGADAIIRRWKTLNPSVAGTGWTALGSLIEAAHAGERAAQDLVSSVIDEMGAALGTVVNLTNPQRVLLGGWVGEKLVAEYPNEIEAAVRRHALARPASQFVLQNTRFGGDAVAAGAGLLPLDALITSGWTSAV